MLAVVLRTEHTTTEDTRMDTMGARLGHSIGLEWCGRPERRYVVRQYGEWVSQHETRALAQAAIAERLSWLS